MTLTSIQIDELMQWAREQAPIARGNDPVGTDLIHVPTRLEIGIEEWEVPLYDYSHDAIVARSCNASTTTYLRIDDAGGLAYLEHRMRERGER